MSHCFVVKPNKQSKEEPKVILEMPLREAEFLLQWINMMSGSTTAYGPVTKALTEALRTDCGK